MGNYDPSDVKVVWLHTTDKKYDVEFVAYQKSTGNQIVVGMDAIGGVFDLLSELGVDLNLNYEEDDLIDDGDLASTLHELEARTKANFKKSQEAKAKALRHQAEELLKEAERLEA